ncbi:MAG: hypothetical protein ACI4IJ_04705 [Acutalibacteraceae bacterium]
MQNSIGTLGEKSLHAVLKQYYESDGSRHEIPVGSYIADIVGEHGIIEIQTRNFIKFKPKLTELLDSARVTVVHPIINQKRIINTEYDTGEVTSSRKSPKHGGVFTCIHELYAVKPLLAHPNLTIRLPVLCADEIRVYGVHTRRRKIQHTRRGEYISDIIPTDIIDEITLDCPNDYRVFLPPDLPSEFGSAEFAKAAGTDIYTARRAVNILNSMQLIEKTGKNGNKIIYTLKST